MLSINNVNNDHPMFFCISISFILMNAIHSIIPNDVDIITNRATLLNPTENKMHTKGKLLSEHF